MLQASNGGRKCHDPRIFQIRCFQLAGEVANISELALHLSFNPKYYDMALRIMILDIGPKKMKVFDISPKRCDQRVSLLLVDYFALTTIAYHCSYECSLIVASNKELLTHSFTHGIIAATRHHNIDELKYIKITMIRIGIGISGSISSNRIVCDSNCAKILKWYRME